MSHHIPRDRRVFFPPNLLKRDNDTTNEMLEKVSQDLIGQYGLHLTLGAEQEYHVGSIGSIMRSVRGDRFWKAQIAYDGMLMGPDPVFCMKSYLDTVRKNRAPRQIMLPPEAQKDEQSTVEAIEELVADKRTEMTAILKEKIGNVDAKNAKELLNDCLNELQLMGDTISHRRKFDKELRELRALRQSIPFDADGEIGEDQIAAMKQHVRTSDTCLERMLQSLVIDPEEARVNPKDNPAYEDHKEEAERLFKTTSRPRAMLVWAFTSGDDAAYEAIRNQCTLDQEGFLRPKTDDEKKSADLSELTKDQIDQLAAKLLRAKIRDQKAMIATIDHYAPVVRRRRIPTDKLEDVKDIIYGESNTLGDRTPDRLLSKISQDRLFGGLDPIGIRKHYVELANTVNKVFDLGLQDVSGANLPLANVRDHMQQLRRTVMQKLDSLSVDDEALTPAKKALKTHLETFAKHVPSWSVAAIAQRERAWRQTEIRELPELKAGLSAIEKALAEKSIPAEEQQEFWKLVNENIEQNRIRRTYGYGSKLDKENVISPEVMAKAKELGLMTQIHKQSTRNDLINASSEGKLFLNTLRNYITCNSYVVEDLMMRTWHEQIEKVYDKIKASIARKDKAYAASLPEHATMDMHVEGAGAEFSREGVTTPLPAEINRVVSRVMSGLLEGNLGESLSFTDHKGNKHTIELKGLEPVCDQFPELFFNAHAGGWQEAIGQHVHYSSKMIHPKTGGLHITPYHEDSVKIETDGRMKEIKKPTDFAYYSHLAMLKLGPDFRAALGYGEGSLWRWQYGLAAPKHFRALYLPESDPAYHQKTRASGDGLKLFPDHGEVRLPDTNADTYLLYTYIAIAQQHAADNYVIDKLNTLEGVKIDANTLKETITTLQDNDAWKAALEHDPVVAQFFQQSETARAAWLERVQKHLEHQVIVPGQFAEKLQAARENGMANGNGEFTLLTFDPAKDTEDKDVFKHPKGKPIVSEPEALAFKQGKTESIMQQWREKLAGALKMHLPNGLGKQVAEMVNPDRGAARTATG